MTEMTETTTVASLDTLAPEILLTIFEQFDSHSTLYQVALVNKNFSELAAKVLYREVSMPEQFLHADPHECFTAITSYLQPLIDNPKYQNYLKKMTLYGLEGDALETNSMYNALSGCQYLTSIKLLDFMPFPYVETHAGILIGGGCLKELEISYAERADAAWCEAYRKHSACPKLDQEEFHNMFLPPIQFEPKLLTSLKLYNIYGSVYAFARYVADMLVDSPRLETLSLSISDTRWRRIGEGDDEHAPTYAYFDETWLSTSLEPRPVLGFWNALCMLYRYYHKAAPSLDPAEEDAAGYPKLGIRKLSLGRGIVAGSAPPLMKKMVDLNSLETLTYGNLKLLKHDPHDENSEWEPKNTIDWDTIFSGSNLSEVIVEDLTSVAMECCISHIQRPIDPLHINKLHCLSRIEDHQVFVQFLQAIAGPNLRSLVINTMWAQYNHFSEKYLEMLGVCTNLEYLSCGVDWTIDEDGWQDEVAKKLGHLRKLDRLKYLYIQNTPESLESSEDKSLVFSSLAELLNDGSWPSLESVFKPTYGGECRVVRESEVVHLQALFTEDAWGDWDRRMLASVDGEDEITNMKGRI